MCNTIYIISNSFYGQFLKTTMGYFGHDQFLRAIADSSKLVITIKV